MLAWNTLLTHPQFATTYYKLTFCMSSRIVSNLLFFTSWLSDSDSFSNSAHTWSINVFCMLNLSNSAGSSFERFSSNHAGYYTYILKKKTKLDTKYQNKIITNYTVSKTSKLPSSVFSWHNYEHVYMICIFSALRHVQCWHICFYPPTQGQRTHFWQWGPKA